MCIIHNNMMFLADKDKHNLLINMMKYISNCVV